MPVAVAQGRALVPCQLCFPQGPAAAGELASWDGHLSLTPRDWGWAGDVVTSLKCGIRE